MSKFINTDKKGVEYDKTAVEQLNFQGYSNAEIAKIMGLDVATVDKQLES